MTHRDHFVLLSVCPSVTLAELCFAGDTCIPRNAATIFWLQTYFNFPGLCSTMTDVGISYSSLILNINCIKLSLYILDWNFIHMYLFCGYMIVIQRILSFTY